MHLIIYLIALLEGFTTLSVEITALRIFAPIIGVNAISTSIILGIILLALSYGYYRGGVISARGKKIELYLLRNLILSSLYYFFLTFIFAELTLKLLLEYVPVYSISLLLTSILLFFIPVFLASQTIPLLAEILKGKHSGEKMGKLLFYSTIGSFAGSVGTSVVLFPAIGVQKTAIVSPMLLSICALLISLFIIKSAKIYKTISIVLVGIYLLSLLIPIKYGPNVLYNKSNAYHTINIYNTGEDLRIFSMDQAYSSGINIYTGKSIFHYIKEIKSKILESDAKNILIIGAAGFTLPNELAEKEEIHLIDVVDIDKDLKEISEKYFLEKRLDRKIDFHVQSARHYLNNLGDKQYDSVVVDVYSGHSLPSQVLTYEFFQQLLTISDDIYLNIISDRPLNTKFSKQLWETIAQGFGGALYYKDTNPGNQNNTNFVVTNKNFDDYIKYTTKNTGIYTDDKHSIELDIFNKNSK